MFLVDKKLQKTKLTLSLLAILHSQAIHTAELSADSNVLASTFTSTDTQFIAADAHSIIWPLLPGESIGSLAALFYPKNQAMQQRFVTRTLQLNQQAGQNLDPATKTNLVGLILIPDIKTLGKNSGKIQSSSHQHRKKSQHSKLAKLHLSYQLKDANLFIVTAKMQTDYDNLVHRNISLKLEVEKLNAKLAKLQLILVGLKTQAIDMLSQLPIAKPVKRTEAIPQHELSDTQPAQSKPVQSVTQSSAPLLPASVLATTSDSDKKTILDPLYLWGLVLLLLTIAVIIFARHAYTRRQAKNLYLAATGNFDPLKTGIFDQLNPVGSQDNVTKVDFSLTQNGLNESMSVVDLSEVEGLDYQEEGELILEQARIYVNIGRHEEATDLLKAQIKAMPKASLHHWLYLLDIYREHQQKNEFLYYAKQLHETFNVMMPLWDNVTLPIVIASSLEEFPHIVKTLTGLWANPEPLTDAQVYIDELLTDNRTSERAGFSMEVFQELITLRDLLTVRAKMAEST